jgi:hypothetical protein
LISDNDILIAGANKESPLCFTYTVVTGKLEKKGSMIEARSAAGIGKIDEYVYIFGGFSLKGTLSSCEGYNTISNRWTTIASLPIPSSSNQAVEHNAHLYIVGRALRSIFTYNPKTDKIIDLPIAIPYGFK